MKSSVMTGLEQALAALEGGAECVGTSGFTQREGVLLATIRRMERVAAWRPWPGKSTVGPTIPPTLRSVGATAGAAASLVEGASR